MLNEISQIQILYDLIYMWNKKKPNNPSPPKKKNKKTLNLDTLNRLEVVRGEGLQKWEKAFKRYKYPVIKQISHGI